ncbi:Peptidyl-prolyl isomerase cwc27, partial [Rhizopus stolonifer]
MSNIYALEPHTNGKVILHTTSGDIEIELWGKEAPRATRNFIQLCLEGYYDNTIFHRIIPDFLVQGGDPTGTGQDGFPNEFHSRLRFNRRGLVGVANSGQDDNGSQFFITLDRADELTRRHTLFGRVAGETLFNVMKMTELELDANERPRYPPKIKRTEVVVNPFDDILPRITEHERLHAIELEKKRAQEEAKKKKKPQKKQLNLLSFGEEAAELEPPVEKAKKMKSAYDFMENAAEPSAEFMEELKKPVKQSAKLEEMKEKAKAKEEERKKAREEQAKRQKELEEERRRKQKEQAPPETRQDAIEKMKQDIRDLSKPVVLEPVKKKEKKKSLVELEREKYGAQKRKKAKKIDDSDVFNSLMSFQKKLSIAQEEEEVAKKEQPPCKIHDIPGCESCRDTTLDVEEEMDDSGWISHKLVFERDLKGKDLMKRKDALDDY